MGRRYMYITCWICTFLCPLSTWGQCGGERPIWARSDFYKDLEKTYLEVVVTTGVSDSDVRAKAQVEIERRRKRTVGEADPWIQSQPVLEYWEECNQGRYTAYFLYQTRRRPTNVPENIIGTNEYSFSPRVFVPGMAQIYKGCTMKGVLFIAGHAAGIGGIVACEGLRASYQSKINTTHNVKDKQAYINNADNMQNLRNGFIAGTVLLYAWNIIDGIVAKGKPHIVIQEGKRLSITPYIAPQQGDIFSGVSLSFNF